MIKDEKGNLVVFNSMMHAVNFFEAIGYELKNVEFMHEADSDETVVRDVYHYILKRKVG